MKVIMLIGLADLLLTVPTYVYYRLIFGFARKWGFFFFYFLMSANIVLSRILPEILPWSVLRSDAYIAGLWLGFLYYSFIIAVIHGLIWVGGSVFHICLPNMKICCVLLTAVLCQMVQGAWCAFHPDLRYEEISTLKLEKGEQMRLAVISDVHLGRILGREFLENLTVLINQNHPDAVLIAGDLLDEKISYVLKDGSLEPLQHLQAPLGVYMAFGNHDYLDDSRRWEKLVQQQGIRILQGSSVTIKNGKVKITGLVDFSRDGGTEGLRMLASGNEDFYSVLLDHQPRRFIAAEEEGYDLYISGHTHTGQLGPNRLITRWMYALDYGRMQYGRMTVIVSSGAGFWGPPIRSSVAPEIVFIDICGTGE